MTDSNPNRIEAADGRYRPDIDGLRALAVVPVVLYHFGIAPFSGGFVGVDIFFVISGFLITSLIHGEMEAGSFSILGFYERRARRILPALYVVMAFSTIVAAVVLFPADFVAFAKSLLATAGFISNFQFWSEAGYFDLDASQKPLLHTWSLAVEEQFYLVFPALLWLLRKTRERMLLIALSALLILSFAASVWAVKHAPVSAFYLLPYRFWELLLGGILAVGRIPVPANAALRNVIAAIGLALILWSIFALTASSPFPGLNALPPCLGAALLIYSGLKSTFVNRVLATRVPVFVGLISYSVYLWHWPLYVFAKYVAPNGLLNPAVSALLIVLSGLLGWLSWRYIEKPFRGRGKLLSQRAVFGYTAVSVLLFAVVGGSVWAGAGWPQRYPADVRQILAAAQSPDSGAVRCFSRSPKAVLAGKLCRVGDRNSVPSFVVWGDSHSMAMLPAIDAVARKQHRDGLFAGHGHCAPLTDVTRTDATNCRPFNAAALKLALSPGILEVVLVARWAEDAGAPPIGIHDRAQIVLFDAQSGKKHDVAGTPAVFASGLERAVRILTAAHRKIVIIASVPENRFPIPEELAKARLLHAPPPIGTSRSDFLARQAFVFSIFEGLAKRYGVTVVYPHEVLCDAATCAVERNGQPLYRDEHHLSAYGATLLTPLVAPAL